MRRGRWTALASAVVAVAALWYLQAPPRSPQAYAERGADTAATLRSQVETARIWAETVADDRTLPTSAAVGLEEADADAATALSDFEELDPPLGGAGTRRAVVGAGSSATEVLAALRIAARDGAWGEVASRRPKLAALGSRLDALERELRR